eukprot:TRINITY_DN165_c0_g1_i17.p1 TRINITY_DN165_c0_g1~~TRINITY_DN165_c0_g1_i17.p1  ORF type:complete len:497 (-),score=121.24 TRINITY_DN165_c0_g1_i17:32-1522(-)
MSSQTLLNAGGERQYRSKHNDPNYQGEQVDPRLTNGPLPERSCTDLVCLFLFVIFLVAVGLMTGVAFKNGDPKRLLHGIDYAGFQCGLDPGYEDYKLIYFGYPFPSDKGDYKTSLTQTVCVKSCPTFNQGQEPPKTLECKTHSLYTTCETTQDISQKDKLYVYSSTNVMDLFCMPFDNALANTIQDVTNIGTITTGIQEVQKNYDTVLIVAGISLVISFVYMFLVRGCARLLVWVIILLYLIGLSALGYFFFKQNEEFAQRKDLPEEERLKKQKMFVALAYGTWGLTVLSLALICCWFQKIQIVTEVLAAAAEYVASETLTLLLPPIIFVLSMIFILYWIVTLAYLWSSGERKEGPNLPFGGWKWSNELHNMVYFHCFSFFWNLSFFVSFLQFSVAGSAVLWYFKRRNPNFQSNETVTTSIGSAIRYHLGSIIFGALILTFARVIRIVYAYIYYTLKKEGLAENAVVQKVALCCACCIESFERFVRHVNTHGFIEV